MPSHAADHQLGHGEREIRVARDRFLDTKRAAWSNDSGRRLELASRCSILAFQEKIIGHAGLSSARSTSVLASAGDKLRLQRIGDFLRDFALDGEDIFHVAVVGFGPKMGIGAGIDELHVDPHLVGRFLHTAFENGGDAELLRNRL